jgi:hypothetical protein
MSGKLRTQPVLWSRRRTVVSALALAAVMAALPESGAGSGPFTGAPSALGLWRNRNAARAIGRRYLAERPHEADATHLARHLFGDGGAVPVSLADIRQAVVAARNRDFAQGDTVLVDGWLLARSEARLCALSVLS